MLKHMYGNTWVANVSIPYSLGVLISKKGCRVKFDPVCSYVPLMKSWYICVFGGKETPRQRVYEHYMLYELSMLIASMN